MQIKDSIAVITGAAQGLGAQIAKRLGERGAKLALIDLDLDKLLALQTVLKGRRIESECYVADVSSEQQVIDVFASVVSHFGRVDALVNNAGIIRDQFLNKPNQMGKLESHSLPNWQSVIDVNLTGVFLCGREASKSMIENKTRGVIINISSISRAGNLGQSNYSAAKAGVIALTVTWAKELARAGIRVGAIAPGFIETEMTQSMKAEILQRITAAVPLQRIGKPDEIAHTVQFIMENDYFSGRTIEVDGGLRI